MSTTVTNMQSIEFANKVVIQTNAAPINLSAEPSLGQSGDGGTFVSNVRISNNHDKNVVQYDPSNNELVYHTTKTFVIDHPTDATKYLVHACLEGPEAGVYYRGRGSITNHTNCTVFLPPYVSSIASNFTVQITPIVDKSTFKPTLGSTRVYYATEVVDNQFDVLGENGQFFWIVYGQRLALEVEVEKTQVQLHGAGPYQWISDLHN